jgi:type I restriction enzyme S subunit
MLNAMKTNIQKYPAYKDSGVEWLGDIPMHWNTLSNKNIFKLKKNQVGKKSGDYVLLSLTLNGVIKRDMENPQGKFPAEFNTYQEVKKGDFIFCLFDVEETPRCVGLSDFDGMITGAYTVMEPYENFDRNFLYYFYLNLDADKRLKPLYTGLRNTISKENFFSFKSFIPPLSEQTAIAAFLDRKTALIDQAIGIKLKQIELLKERRQILIHKAVTRGLNPNAKMKESGVEWIGEIPEGWTVTSVKHVLEMPICDGPHTTPQLYLEGYPFVSAEAIKNGEVDFDKIRGFISLKDYLQFSKKYSPKRNDIYMVKSGATTGNVAMVRTDIEFSIWSPLAVFRANQKKVIPNYLLNYLESPTFRLGVELSWSFGTQQNIGMGILSNLPIAFPYLDEQILISEYISRVTDKVKSAISLKEQEIEKLKEYKATLINSAVTGKIKVC